jgi:hypothetical protein
VLHPESPETQSVFLDELAGAMAEVGKVVIVTLEEAIRVIDRQSLSRIIASMLGGKYLELCAAWSPDCIFCKAERAGYPLLRRSARDSNLKFSIPCHPIYRLSNICLRADGGGGRDHVSQDVR